MIPEHRYEDIASQLKIFCFVTSQMHDDNSSKPSLAVDTRIPSSLSKSRLKVKSRNACCPSTYAGVSVFDVSRLVFCFGFAWSIVVAASKLDVSVGLVTTGMNGALCVRRTENGTPEKYGWDLTSLAPFLPSRSSWLQQSFRMRSHVASDRLALSGIRSVNGQCTTYPRNDQKIK